MNASSNEVALILDAIQSVRDDQHELRAEVQGYRADLNGRLRKLERWRYYVAGFTAACMAISGFLFA